MAVRKLAPVAEKTNLSIQDMLLELAEGLHHQAAEPNLLAYQPHPKQVKFHESTASSKLYIGGNRSGKSTAGVVEDLWWVTKRHPYRQLPPGPLRGRVIGVDFTTGIDQILIPIFKRWIIPSDLINGSWEDSWTARSRTLRLANKSSIDFKSYEQSTLQQAGVSRHFTHFDEEPPKSIFDENLTRLVDTNGSWWITMTPTEGMTWVYFDLYETKPNNLLVIEVDMDDNPYLSKEAKETLLGFLDEEDRKTRKSGKFTTKGGLVFKHFNDRYPYVINNWMPPAGWGVYISIDHGINNPTAICWHAVSPTGDRVITFHCYYQTNKIVADHAKYIHRFNRENHLQPLLVTGDPAMKQRNGVTGSSIVQEYAKRGIHLALEGVPKDVGIGLEKMMMYLKIRSASHQPTWQMTQDCQPLIREMMLYSWKTAISPKVADRINPYQVPNKKNDHAIDSSRYFFTLMPDLVPEFGEEFDDTIEFDPGTIYDTLAKMAELPTRQNMLGLWRAPSVAQVVRHNKGLSESDPENWTITSRQPEHRYSDGMEDD